LLVAETRGSIALLNGGGDSSAARTELAPKGWWPTWGASGRIAYSVVSAGAPTGSSTALKVVALDGGEPIDLIRSEPAALIAAHLAHYSLWDTTGGRLCYAAPDNGELGFSVWDAATNTSSEVARGGPLFPAWQPNGDLLAVHQGTALRVFDAKLGGPPMVVSDDATGFRTPAFSSDGHYLCYTVAGASGVEVMCASPDGRDARGLGRMPGGVALGFRPGTNELGLGVTTSPGSGMFDGLFLMDLETGNVARRVTRGPFSASWWAPSGEMVALLVPTQSGDGRFQLRVVEVDGAPVATGEAFVPSQDFRTLSGFYDQYALSHRLWAPDSSAMVMSGHLANDGVSAAFGDPSGDSLFSWSAERGAPLQRVADAGIGFFQPA